MNKYTALVLFAMASHVLLRAETLAAPDVIIPPYAAWTVDITYRDTGQTPSAKTPAQPKRTRIEATRTGDITRYYTTWTNGRTTEDWTTSLFVFWQNETSGQAVIVRQDDPAAHYSPVDQSCFGWMHSGQFKIDREGYQGKDCIHVRSDNTQAWVETKTQLPVAFDDSAALYYFSFQKPPTAPLSLPPKYQALLDRYISSRTAPKRAGY